MKRRLILAKELLNEHSTFLIPYLAEVYFITSKFDIVKSLLNKTKGLDFNAKLHPIMAQWKSAS